MGLSVTANSGNGLANLFRQARAAKPAEDGTPAAEPAGTTAVSLRPLGRSGIDSTGSGTAQISAALTVCLSKLGDDAGAGADGAAKAATVTPLRSTPGGAGRSSAADLLRVLDSYGTGRDRLRA